MNTINNEPAIQLSIYKHCLVIAFLVAIVYVPVLFFPYLLLDDNWLVRRSDGVPNLDFVSGIQGRPFFALLIWLTRVLTGNSDTPTNVMPTITLVRGLAIVALCGFAVGLFKWLVEWGSPIRSAFLTAIVAVTLPSLAMYVLGGPWLTAALIGALIAVHFVLKAAQAENPSDRRRWLLRALAVQVLCWATYQGTAPVTAALILLVFIGSDRHDWDFTRRWSSLSQRAKFIVLGSAVFLLSLIIYIILWKIVFYLLYKGQAVSHYSPSAIKALRPSVIQHFFSVRLIQMMNLWSVEGLTKTGFFWLSLAAVALAVLKDMTADAKIFAAVKWFLILAGLIVLDMPALSAGSGGGPNPIFSYMTSAALAVALAGIFNYRLFPLIANAAKPKLQFVLLGIVLIMAMTFCMTRALTNFAVPLWLEYRYVRSEIEFFSKTHGGVEGLRFVERGPPLLNTGVQEFSWSNLQSSMYIHWMSRNVLDELKLKSRIRIDVTNASGQVLTSPDYDREPDPLKILTIDTAHLRLN